MSIQSQFMIVCFDDWNAYVGISKGENNLTNYTMCCADMNVGNVGKDVVLNSKQVIPKYGNSYYVWQDLRIAVKSVSEMLVPMCHIWQNMIAGVQHYQDQSQGLIKKVYAISPIKIRNKSTTYAGVIEPFIMRMGALDMYRLFNLCLNDKLPLGVKSLLQNIQYNTSGACMVTIDNADDFVTLYSFAQSQESKTPAVEPAPWEPDQDCYFSSEDEDDMSVAIAYDDLIAPPVVRGNACLLALCINSVCDAYTTLDPMFIRKVLVGLVLEGNVIDFVGGFNANSGIRNSIALELVSCCKGLPSIMVWEIARQCDATLATINRFDTRMQCTFKSLRETLVMMLFTRRCEVVWMFKKATRNWAYQCT